MEKSDVHDGGRDTGEKLFTVHRVMNDMTRWYYSDGALVSSTILAYVRVWSTTWIWSSNGHIVPKPIVARRERENDNFSNQLEIAGRPL